jgi:hypothetical protein
MQKVMDGTMSLLERCFEHWEQFLKRSPGPYLEWSDSGRVLLSALTFAPFFILTVCVNLLFISLAAFPVTWLWNYFAPALFGFGALNYWEVFVLLIVGALLPAIQLTYNR